MIAMAAAQLEFHLDLFELLFLKQNVRSSFKFELRAFKSAFSSSLSAVIGSSPPTTCRSARFREKSSIKLILAGGELQVGQASFSNCRK